MKNSKTANTTKATKPAKKKPTDKQICDSCVKSNERLEKAKAKIAKPDIIEQARKERKNG